MRDIRAARVRALVLSAAFLIQLSACYSWHTEPLVSPQTVNHGEDIRITLATGEPVVLRGGALVAGRVSGFTEAGRGISVPVQGVRRIELRRCDLVATAALGAGLTGLVLGTAYLVAAASLPHWSR